MASPKNQSRRRRRPELNPKKKRIVHKFREEDVVDYKDDSDSSSPRNRGRKGGPANEGRSS